MESAKASVPSRSLEDCERWMQRIHQAHTQRSPQAWESARQRLEEARQQEISLRRCKAVKSHAIRSRALATEGLRQISSSRSPVEYSAAQARWTSAQAASESRQMRVLEALSAPAAASYEATPLACADEEEEQAMHEVADLVGAQDVGLMAALGREGIDSAQHAFPGPGFPTPGIELAPSGAVQALLDQLRTEPEDEAESAAKFGLYEGYAREVEKMRGSLLTFHQESRDTVPSAVAVDMDRQVKSIDSTEAMGIFDDAREWFVYHMMRQAERNNVKMAAMLDGFEKRLEFLTSNSQLECPICLDVFGEAGAETLSCCHKVCKDCWEHWVAVTHGRAFCPLCRHEEFIGTVAARVSPGLA